MSNVCGYPPLDATQRSMASGVQKSRCIPSSNIGKIHRIWNLGCLIVPRPTDRPHVGVVLTEPMVCNNDDDVP
ncbi:hypothetical protein PG993_003628 [Apiospora rasikravindrae]|uniref:Uncharacterized protein n=1 Tax=Apiospora rasikravindrae TaxID=990691 RepID=A0ABR1U022_9PEZI